MAHGIKKEIIIDIKEEFECNNNQHQSVNSICKNNKMAFNGLLLDNCSNSSSSSTSTTTATTNQNLLNQKNSSTTTNAFVGASAITHPTLPPTHATLMNNSNKLTLNCSGASMSTITKSPTTATGTKMGSRRIFTPQFKLQVLESYRNDSDCKGNQRATARKYGIHRRQIQKWLQCENNLRSIIANNPQNIRNGNAMKSISKATAPILSTVSTATTTNSRHRGVVNTDKNGSGGVTYSCFTLANVKSYKANNTVGSTTTTTTTTTKSLVSSSSSPSSSSFAAFENFATNVASANLNLPPQLHNSNSNNNNNSNNHLIVNNNFYFDNSHMIFNKFEELPIDLSCSSSSNIKIKSETVARPIPLHPSTLSNYKIPFYNFSPIVAATASTPSSSPHLIDISNSVVKSEQQHCIDPIDLSISNVSHKRKHSTDNESNKKPIKLFRPYLESNFDNAAECDGGEGEKSSCDDAIVKDEHNQAQKFPIIWSNAYNFYPDHISDFPSATTGNHSFLLNTSSTSPYDHHHHHLAITSSSPTSSALSSPNDSGIMNSSFHRHSTLLPPSQASPVSGYDSSTSSIYSFNDNEVDLSEGNSPPYTSSHYDAPSPPPLSSATLSPTTAETKVPLSSSFIHDLKFKLYTLDCYYNDAECKRDEKRVANKLNINSKVVEKWLRQESDLREQQKQYHLQILV